MALRGRQTGRRKFGADGSWDPAKQNYRFRSPEGEEGEVSAWFALPGESEVQYRAFRAWLLRAVRGNVRMGAVAKGTKLDVETLREWRKIWKWEERRKKLEEDKRERDRAYIQGVQSRMTAEHLRLSQLVARELRRGITGDLVPTEDGKARRRVRDKRFTPMACCRMAEAVVNIQRLALGQPIEGGMPAPGELPKEVTAVYRARHELLETMDDAKLGQILKQLIRAGEPVEGAESGAGGVGGGGTNGSSPDRPDANALVGSPREVHPG